jgi:hypothetical protein
MPERFRLEIEGLDTLLAFLALIRDEYPTLPEMTARLQRSTDVLSAAEQADADHVSLKPLEGE